MKTSNLLINCITIFDGEKADSMDGCHPKGGNGNACAVCQHVQNGETAPWQKTLNKLNADAVGEKPGGMRERDVGSVSRSPGEEPKNDIGSSMLGLVPDIYGDGAGDWNQRECGDGTQCKGQDTARKGNGFFDGDGHGKGI